MALLALTSVTRAGTDTAGAAADVAGDTFPNAGREYLVVKNSSASPITVTLDVTMTVDGQTVVDPTVSVPAGGERIIGPWPTGIYNDANGRVKATCSAIASVTVKALTLAAA